MHFMSRMGSPLCLCARKPGDLMSDAVPCITRQYFRDSTAETISYKIFIEDLSKLSEIIVIKKKMVR